MARGRRGSAGPAAAGNPATAASPPAWSKEDVAALLEITVHQAAQALCAEVPRQWVGEPVVLWGIGGPGGARALRPDAVVEQLRLLRAAGAHERALIEARSRMATHEKVIRELGERRDGIGRLSRLRSAETRAEADELEARIASLEVARDDFGRFIAEEPPAIDEDRADILRSGEGEVLLRQRLREALADRHVDDCRELLAGAHSMRGDATRAASVRSAPDAPFIQAKRLAAMSPVPGGWDPLSADRMTHQLAEAIGAPPMPAPAPARPAGRAGASLRDSLGR